MHFKHLFGQSDLFGKGNKYLIVIVCESEVHPNQKHHQKSHKKSPITKKMGPFHDKILCLEKPKMQNKHLPVGTKSQLLPIFLWFL